MRFLLMTKMFWILCSSVRNLEKIGIKCSRIFSCGNVSVREGDNVSRRVELASKKRGCLVGD
jgi:hypothetical protein